MSRTVHILKLHEEHQEFIDLVTENVNKCQFLSSNINKKWFREVIDEKNKALGCSIGPHLYKGLSIPRLKILVALVAKKNGIKFFHEHFKFKLEFIGNLEKTPQRFQQKFIPLLVNGVWFLGTAIEDSLSEDPNVNCGNPFGFEKGDMGFWWAALVVLDWLKYRKSHFPGMSRKPHLKCIEFYSDPCISRKYKYNQNSGLSSLDRTPQQFLDHVDERNFRDTITQLNYTYYLELFGEVLAREKRNELDDAFLDYVQDIRRNNSNLR